MTTVRVPACSVPPVPGGRDADDDAGTVAPHHPSPAANGSTPGADRDTDRGSELDADLEQAFADRTPGALEDVYRRFGATIHTFARRAVGPEVAAELTQDVFVAA